MYNKILLPTDGSPSARRAGKHGMWIADKSGADIVVLNVIDVNYLQPSYLPSFREDLDENLRNEGRMALENFKADLEENQCHGVCKNINFSLKIREGKPYLEILKSIEDENIDLVVMGASGRHGIDRFTLGSVTERVLREAKVPVMVIP